MKKAVVALAGNPNVGKSAIFNALTGAKQKLGNWPGVTVEKKEGICKYKDIEMHIVDLPGIYGLTASSIDEKIARDFILHNKPDLVVDIVDASNIERNLYLTLQLIEMDANIVIALNKVDLAESKGYKIDAKKLSEKLGLPVVPTVAIRNKGIEELKRAMYNAIKTKIKSSLRYNDKLESVISLIEQKVVEKRVLPEYPSRFVAIRLLEGDEEILRSANLQEEVIKQWILQRS